jgi:hypothetical protein
VSVADRTAEKPVQPLVGATLEPVQVTGGMKEDGSPAATVGMNAERRLLGHRAAGEEDRRRHPQQRRDLPLQLRDHTTLAVAVGDNVRRDIGEQLGGRAPSVPVQEAGTGIAQSILIDRCRTISDGAAYRSDRAARADHRINLLPGLLMRPCGNPV